MSHEVYANKWEIAGKAGMNKSTSRFPDVCMSPPSPPAGPIPVPYPNTSFSSDLKEGSTTVLVDGKPAALAQQSYYQPSVLGDEAATRSFGANIITHQITGKTYFQAWSMDVKFEGKNICRHMDITTSNHASGGTTTVPAPTNEAETQALIDQGLCPCCRKPLHEWQKDDAGNALPTIKEADFYKKKADFYRGRAAELPKFPALMTKAATGAKAAAEAAKFLIPGEAQTVGNIIAGKGRFYDGVEKKLAALRADNPDCPNVHNPADVGCGAHFDLPPGEFVRKNKAGGDVKATLAQHCERALTDTERWASISEWEKKTGTPIKNSEKVNHKTPKQAGACNSKDNLVPDPVLSGPCREIEELQSELHSSGA